MRPDPLTDEALTRMVRCGHIENHQPERQMFTDLLRSIRLGWREMRRDFKLRRRLRKFRAMPGAF